MRKSDVFEMEYNQEDWMEFAQCFQQVEVSVEEIPPDIVNAVCTILGVECGIKWLETPLNAFEGKSAVELVKSKGGCKALKAFIMRLPN